MDDLTKLEELAIQNMLLRINTTFDQYSSLILSLKESKEIKSKY